MKFLEKYYLFTKPEGSVEKGFLESVRNTNVDSIDSEVT